jgi:uncharacterized protein YecT (DUF1311 family)
MRPVAVLLRARVSRERGALRMRLLLAFLAIVAVPSLACAQRNASAEQRCYELSSEVEARDCLEQFDAQSRQKVDEVQKELLAALQRWDQEPAYRTASTDALRMANSRFEQFREAQCEYIASLAAGGNAAGDRRLLCRIEMNEQRARQLRSEVGRLR